MQGEAAVVARAEEPPPQGRERVLCVDDEAAVARVMQALLTRLGYEVQVYTNSVDALAAFRAAPQRFDLVVTDHTMPAMTGKILAGELRRIRADIPIILCTGHSSSDDSEMSALAGVNAVLMKPVASADLARTIRQVFAQRQAQGA
jgi:CheY-like chemotaxis protein